VCFSAVGGNMVDKLFDALKPPQAALQNVGVIDTQHVFAHALNPGVCNLFNQGAYARAGTEQLTQFGQGLLVCHFLRWLPGQWPQGGTGFIGAGRWGGVLENMSQLYNSVVYAQQSSLMRFF